MDANLTIIGRVSPTCPDNLEESAAPVFGAEQKTTAEVVIDAPYTEGLMSLEPGMEVTLLCWLHQAQRDVLQVYPRGDMSRPMRGIFNTRSCSRPNPIGLHEVIIQKIIKRPDGNATMTVLPVEKDVLDVYANTPLIDIKTNSSQRAAFAASREDPLFTEDEEQAALDLILQCRKAWERGLMSGFNGNMSVKVGDNCLITATGAVKGQLGKKNLAVVNINSGQLVRGNKPSSELAMHLELYKAQPDAQAIVHTHPPKLLALSELVQSNLLLKLPIYEAAPLRERMGIAEAQPPGTNEVAMSVAKVACCNEAVLMKKHGLCCWGQSLKEPLALSEELEHLAGIQLMLMQHSH